MPASAAPAAPPSEVIKPSVIELEVTPSFVAFVAAMAGCALIPVNTRARERAAAVTAVNVRGFPSLTCRTNLENELSARRRQAAPADLTCREPKPIVDSIVVPPRFYLADRQEYL